MRALILADESFACRERAMLSRLEVGLADEGVRVVHAIPRSATAVIPHDVFSQAVLYDDHGPGLTRPWRARRLERDLAALAPPESPRSIDTIHAFGEGCWSLAVSLARLTGAALAFEVWSAAIAPQVVRLRLGAARDGALLTPVFFAPDTLIERALKAEVGAAGGPAVRLAPWGVHVPSSAHPLPAPGKAVSAMLCGGGRDAGAWAAAIEGLAVAARQEPDLLFFADAEAIRLARAWPLVTRLGLLDRFTLIPDMEAKRELVLRGDVLLLPEARGEHRSIALEAMATGMIVVAAADPKVAYLIDGQTARLVPRCTPDQWSDRTVSIISDPAPASALVASAREYVRQHHRVSAQVAAVLDAYEWLTTAESIPFQPDRAREDVR